MLTGPAHGGGGCAVGALAHLLAVADFDDSPLDATRRGLTSPIKAPNLAIIRLFLDPMPHQAAEPAKALQSKRFDAIIADYGFFGVLPLLIGDPARRPPVLYYTPTPLMLSSRDTAPNGLVCCPATRCGATAPSTCSRSGCCCVRRTMPPTRCSKPSAAGHFPPSYWTAAGSRTG